MSAPELFRKMMQPIEGRVRGMLARAVVNLINDAAQIQELQVDLLAVHHRCADAGTYRAARVKSLFNVEDQATRFDLEADLPALDEPWQIGVIVGPSGSGKSSLGAALGPFYEPDWPEGAPIRWAIHMREAVTGGTIYWMDDGADTGPIALQEWCHILPEDDAASLWRRELGPMGLRLFALALSLAEAGKLPRLEQDEAAATWEPAYRARPLNAL